jgi:hypothetical protein
MLKQTLARLSPLLMLGVAVIGCKDLTAAPGLPAGTPDPAYYASAAGAIGLRNAAILRFENAWVSYMWDSGALTDELEDNLTSHVSPGQLLQNGGQISDPLDERILPPGTIGGMATYGLLQEARADAANAIGALAHYDTATAEVDTAMVLESELYSLEGYAEIMLADLFCSGVPLSTLDFQKDFTYKPGSTSSQVYLDAILKFDSAVVLAGTNDSVRYLAQMGQGRAYLEWGCPNCYAAAADDVSGVPTTYTSTYYGVMFGGTSNNLVGSTVALVEPYNVADREGNNGLPFVSSDDPRSAVGVDSFTYQSNGIKLFVDSVLYPLKYDPQGTIPQPYSSISLYSHFIVANGIEARLIQAEAALNGVSTGQGSWINQLNALRETIGLPNIADPGASNPAAQVDTMLTERAEWLWLTGHRQGDLRRALRQYSRYARFGNQQNVYPSGAYLAGGAGIYGTAVVVPVPLSEDANPYFHGCLSYEP